MPFYRVTYSSMTAQYGPSFIEAEDEYHAKRIFAQHGGFSVGEQAFCMTAREVSSKEIAEALRAKGTRT